MPGIVWLLTWNLFKFYQVLKTRCHSNEFAHLRVPLPNWNQHHRSIARIGKISAFFCYLPIYISYSMWMGSHYVQQKLEAAQLQCQNLIFAHISFIVVFRYIVRFGCLPIVWTFTWNEISWVLPFTPDTTCHMPWPSYSFWNSGKTQVSCCGKEFPVWSGRCT